MNEMNTDLKNIGSLAGTALLATALCGCMVGPDYVEPKVNSPATWVGGAATQPAEGVRVTAEQARLIGWWTSFEDPTLTSLIERAVKSNLDVKLARSRIRQARAAHGIAEGGLFPTINSSGSYTRRGPAPDAQSNMFRAGVDAAWELDVFGGTRRGMESAKADIQAAVDDERGVLVSLVAEVALNYVDLRAQQARLVIARESLETMKRSAALTRKLKDAGFAAGLDVAQAEGDVASTEAQLPVLEASIQQTIFAISLLLAREPGALTEELSAKVAGNADSILAMPPELPVGMPSELLRRRPDIRRAESQVRSANAQIGAAMSDLFPKFTLSGSIGLEGNKLSSMANWASRSWSVGPSVTWQIFDAGRITSNIEVKKAQTEQALLTYHKTVLTAFSEMDSALEALAREQTRTKPLAAARAADRKSLAISTELYTGGQTAFLNVLTAQRSLFSAEDAIVQSRRNVAANVIAIYKALGGGWEAIDQMPMEPMEKQVQAVYLKLVPKPAPDRSAIRR